MILNFKEIPQANTGNGDQDTFELFARDFLEVLGYEILQHPDRGADGKKDLIIQETRFGISGQTKIKWLVSCKHYAHSGKSVNDNDESNIYDRVKVHKCDGFLGFYSTIPATSLGTNLNALKDNIHIEYFDREKIEKNLLDTPEGIKLTSRYFPKSFENYKVENPKPAKIFHGDSIIECEHCNRNLLDNKEGIFVTLRERTDWDNPNRLPNHYIYAYFSCKGQCDAILKNQYMQNGILIDEWADISDYLSPVTYIKKQMAWMNAIQIDRETLSVEAFDKLKKLFINSYPFVSREQTTEEKENVKFYLQNGLMDWL